MKKKISIISVLVILIVIACGTGSINQVNNSGPKNVILIIGDGMGLGQIQAALTANKGSLNITDMPVTGFHKTYSANDYITDSGAGATAFATGTKTKNGSIGVDSNGISLANIIELAEKKGIGAGLVSTSSIVHATPASFIAHQPDRYLYENIAKDFLKTDIDVFIGGGYDYFAHRSDSIDLTVELRKKGYTVYTLIDSIKNYKGNKLAGLTAPDHNLTMIEGRGDMLLQSAKKAIEILSENKNGFFLMIEGSMIDWGCHENNQAYFISELLDLDNMVGYVNEFAVKNRETLVIITADHETGGTVVVNGDYNSGNVEVTFTSKDHTGNMVPVFAFGPGAEKFTGVYENTDIFYKIKELLGL